MTVYSFSGRLEQVKSTLLRELSEPTTTYNLVVDVDHDYFVGENHILVHNGRAGWGSVLPGNNGPPNGSLVNGGLDEAGQPAGTIRH